MLRLLILAFGVLWAAATIARLAKGLGRSPARPIRGAQPAPPPPPAGDRLIGLLRSVLAVVFVVGFAALLFAFTGLPDVAVILITAPVAGLAAALLTELFVTDDRADPTEARPRRADEGPGGP